MANDYKELQKNIQSLLDSKQSIIKKWVNDGDVLAIFKNHGIDINLFSNHFATRIYDYFLGVVEECNEAGNCPAVNVMLRFFETKNITMEEVYVICDNFKKALLASLLESNILNRKILEETFHLFGQNFTGVIREYLEHNYTKTPKKPAPKKVVQASEAEAKPKPIIAQSTLEEIEEYFDKYSDLYYKTSVSDEESIEFVENFKKLGDTLILFGAKGLGERFVDLANTLSKELESLKMHWKKFAALFEALDNDIRVWNAGIATETNVDFIEETIQANIEQIKASLRKEDDTSDIELF